MEFAGNTGGGRGRDGGRRRLQGALVEVFALAGGGDGMAEARVHERGWMDVGGLPWVCAWPR